MKYYNFEKLAVLKDKYPLERNFIEGLVVIIFRNNGEIPKRDFAVDGWIINPRDGEAILTELGIKPVSVRFRNIKGAYYTQPRTTSVEYKKV